VSKKAIRIKEAKKGKGEDHRCSPEPEGRGGGLATEYRIRKQK
jgi:hypothetical protein